MGNGTEGTGEEPRVPRQSPAPTEAELRKRFFYRAPRDAMAIERHERVSHATFDLALELCVLCAPGRNL